MAKAPQASFGRWTFNPSNGCLEIDLPPKYEVPLKDFTTSASVLDWILQAAEKVPATATATDIGDLVNAILHIFGRGVAGFGIDRPVDGKKILEREFGCKLP